MERGNGVERDDGAGLRERKRMRLKGYDYRQAGAYFITVCSKNFRNVFGEAIVGDGVLDVPRIRLSGYGIIIDKYINSIGAAYENISIDKYVIMPNHIHMIISIYNAVMGTSGTPSPTNATIPFIVSTLKRFTNKESGSTLWQRSYYDHIIRNEEEYRKIWQYIDENPAKWAEDEYFGN